MSLHGRPLELEEMVEKVEAVTAADLARLAAATLASEPTLAAIGPPGSLPRRADLSREGRPRGGGGLVHGVPARHVRL